MSREQLSAALSHLDEGQDPAPTFLTDRHRHAVDQLNKAFSAGQPLAVLLGEGRSASSFVIQSFVSSLAGDVAVARIEDPCLSAADFMGKVIDAVGFQPMDMSLEDLEGIFMMFLSFQKSHGRRTVLCIEAAQDHDLWVLDKVRSLVEQEGETRFGVMLVISGQAGLKELLHSGPLSAVAGKRIVLPRFTLAESTKYISQRLETAGKLGIDQLFQYRAIKRIHELSKGVPDEVAALVNRCLEAAAAEGISLVTTELVQRAYDTSRETSPGPDNNAETINMQGFRPRTGRLVFQVTGEDVREMTLRHGHTLIGRSTLCDIRIDSSTVSRRHALISFSSDGATLVDLNSTNGTFVGGRQIRRYKLQPGDTIEVGGTRIEFVVEAGTSEAELAASRQASH